MADIYRLVCQTDTLERSRKQTLSDINTRQRERIAHFARATVQQQLLKYQSSQCPLCVDNPDRRPHLFKDLF